MEPMTFLKRDVGKMSRGQEKVFIQLTKLVRSWCVIGEKLCRIVGREEYEIMQRAWRERSPQSRIKLAKEAIEKNQE